MHSIAAIRVDIANVATAILSQQSLLTYGNPVLTTELLLKRDPTPLVASALVGRQKPRIEPSERLQASIVLSSYLLEKERHQEIK